MSDKRVDYAAAAEALHRLSCNCGKPLGSFHHVTTQKWLDDARRIVDAALDEEAPE